MFCYQCQEAAKNEGCTVKGMCGKPEETACLQDLLIYALRGQGRRVVCGPVPFCHHHQCQL
jgi:hydroxylamine reductase (hybrid-cluster protein)